MGGVRQKMNILFIMGMRFLIDRIFLSIPGGRKRRYFRTKTAIFSAVNVSLPI